MLTLHSDRGAPMTSKCTAQLLADLGVTRSLSRPQVSDDNPFSEAQCVMLTRMWITLVPPLGSAKLGVSFRPFRN